MGDWTEVPFAEAIDFQEGPGIMAADFRERGVPLIRLAGLERGRTILAGCNFLDPSAVARRWSHFALREGDILLSSSASLGRIAVVGAEAKGAIPYTGIIRMRPRDDRVYAPFIRYLLEAPDFQRQAEIAGVGSVMRHFGPMHLRQMTVRLPSVATQHRITEVLGALDDKVELNARWSQTLEDTMRLLFKRLCLEGPRDSVGSWVETRLGGVVDLVVERCVAGAETRARPYVPIDSLQARSLVIGAYRPGSDAQTSLIRFKAGDILFGAMRPYFHKVSLAPFDGTTRTTVFVLRAPRRSNTAFVLLLLDLDETVDWATRHSTGSTIPYAVWQGSLAEMPVTLPPEAVRARLSESIAPMLARLQQFHEESSLLAEIRDALLPRLLSGDLAVAA